MALAELRLPLLSTAFYSAGDKSKVSDLAHSIGYTYYNEIRQAGFNSNVLESLITAIIFVESAGNKAAVGGRAIGLMQIDPTTADEVIWMENNKHRLNDKEAVVLHKQLGSRLDAIRSKRMATGASPRVTPSDLFDPEFNIQIGTILLGLLVDEHTESNIVRLDKVILRYNRGYYFKPFDGTPSQVYASISKVSKISADYVIKICGTNNVIDLMA